MGVSKNRGTPNGWLIMENPIKMDDLGGKPTIFGNIHILQGTITWDPPLRYLLVDPGTWKSASVWSGFCSFPGSCGTLHTLFLCINLFAHIYIYMYILSTCATKMIYTDYEQSVYIYMLIFMHIHIRFPIPFPGTTYISILNAWFSMFGISTPKNSLLPTSIPGTAWQVPLMHQRFAAEMQGVVLNAETAVMSALKQMESQVTDQDQKNLGVFSKGGPFGWLMFL